MRVRDNPAVHLTYCLNIHPGETWAENFAAIGDKALAVRAAVAPGKPFGLGLRLSARAAEELADKERLDEFRGFLSDHQLYVFTINGFPYGQFHGSTVKENVYAPDWRTRERRDYTMRLIDILAELLPPDVCGSISTVPGSYKAWITNQEQGREMARQIAFAAAHAGRVYRRTGRDICIALEPEPDCHVETTREALRFFVNLRFGIPVVRDHLKCSADEAAEVLMRHVGVCLDTAHAAVQFEDPAESLRLLREAGIRVAKVQLSAALRAEGPEQPLERMGEFVDPVYLHQTRIRHADGAVEAFADLPQALAAHRPAEGLAGDDWRVHFHVPLFWQGDAALGSTGELLTREFWRQALAATSNLEIETYTFNVLPDDIRPRDVTESISREYEWVMQRIAD